jgi:hypothetical protein
VGDDVTYLSQEAPYPAELEDLVRRLTYRQGYRFELRDIDRGQGSKGLTLVITVTTPDSYDQDHIISVTHYMTVPPASFNERSWRWWLFQQIGWVEQHERMEFFQIDGKPAYPPAHGPGNDPYLILDYGSDTDRRTSFRGELNPP